MTIRCGTLGFWELLEEYEHQDGDTLKFHVGKSVDKDNFTSMCPYSTLSAREDLMRMTFWAKLSDDERAMFMILALGCFGSLTGLACTYFLSPYVSSQDEAEEEEEEHPEDKTTVDGILVDDAENPSLRRFNLLTGEVETRRQLRAGKIASLQLLHIADFCLRMCQGAASSANAAAEVPRPEWRGQWSMETLNCNGLTCGVEAHLQLVG